MGILDIILAVLLGYGLFRGLKNGFFVEISSVIALIAGIYGAIHFSYITSDYLSQQLDWDATYIKITAFIITFIAIVVAVHLLGKVLTRMADFAMLGLLNRIAGGIFGIVKVAVILGAFLIFLERASLPLHWMDPEAFEESIFYGPLKETGAFVFSKVLEPELMDELIENK
jgi:membrane protein required for colicin V production